MLSLVKNEGYFFLFIIGLCLVGTDAMYNMKDPDCTGKFGSCTQEDKTRLGYAAIKKLHEKMDEDKDGGIEVEETKDFIKEDLEMKNGNSAKQLKDSNGDGSISVDELWKSWEHSEAYNWTSDQMVTWLTDHLNLPGYTENFKRNMIDGQFLPRLVTNENHYYSNVLHIKDPRHKRLMILKATDIVLFGVPPNIVMVGLLTISIFICICLYRQHRTSSEQIKKMLLEFEKLNVMEENDRLDANSVPLNFARLANTKRPSNSQSIGEDVNFERAYPGELKKTSSQDDDSVYKLQLAELELKRLKATLDKTQSQLDLVRYQPPLPLIHMLNKTYECEKALLEFKLSSIEKEKDEVSSNFRKVCRNQSGFLGAFKTAHSSALEEIQQKLEGIKLKHQKLKIEQQESTKRWNHIFEICVRQEQSNATASDQHSSQETNSNSNNGLITVENCQDMPRKNWQAQTSQNSANTNTTNANNSNNKNGLVTEHFYSNVLQLLKENLAKSLISTDVNSVSNASSYLLEFGKLLENTSIHSKATSSSSNEVALNKNPCDSPVYGANGYHEASQRANRYEELRSSQPNSFRSMTQNSLSSCEISASSGRIDSTRNCKYTIGDRISTVPNLKFPVVNQKIEFNLDSSEEISAINASNSLNGIHETSSKQSSYIENNNNTDKYSNGTPLPPNNKLVIISPANLPQIQPISPQHSKSFGSLPITNGKISRDSIIHGTTDMFQFSEVDSVHTADFFFKNTPQSSFDSQDTYKSNSLLPTLIKSRNSKHRSQIVTNAEYNPKEKKLSFLTRASFSKLPKTPVEKERSEGDTDKMERTSTLSFSKTMNNLRHKIFNSNKNLFSSHQSLKPVQTEDKTDPISLSKPEIVITPSVNSTVQLSSIQSGTKQLTISNLKADSSETNEVPLSSTNRSDSSNNLNVSMNRSPASIQSFTVQSIQSNGDVSPEPKTITKDTERKTPNSIFSLGVGKHKKSKSKSPKKKKV